MVSTRTPKTAKASYAERVMGAFSQLQREHKKHAIHPAALRAQVKKNAQVKQDKLGPNWSHWVGRALSKMEEEGIFEPATPNGSIALTSKGKKAVNYARRSVRKSIGLPPGQNEDDLLWKEVTSYSASKRPRTSSLHDQYLSDDSDAYHTPSKLSPKKRARLSLHRSAKKTITKTPKRQPAPRLNGVKVQLPNFERESLSPLTDLGSDDEVVATNMQEELRERNQNMRRDLVAARETQSADGYSGDHNDCISTPQANVHTSVDNPFSPVPGDDILLSLNRLGGIEHSASGSLLSNTSRPPVPPLSILDTNVNNSEFYNQACLASTHTAAVEKGLSNRVTNLERTVIERNVTIDALRKESAAYKAELAALQDSWKRANEMVTVTGEQLTVSEALVGELRAERESKAQKINSLESANEDLIQRNEALKTDLEQANAGYSDIKTVNDSLRAEKSIIANELATLREETRQAISQLEEALSRASNDAQEFQRKVGECELSIARYQAEFEEKKRACQRLETQIRDSELELEQTRARLSVTERAANESSAQLATTRTDIASLAGDLARVHRQEASLQVSLEEAVENLKSEETKSLDLRMQLSDKERELHATQRDVIEARLTIQRIRAEMTGKDDSIGRLLSENDKIQRRLSAAEESLVDLRNVQEVERVDSARRLAEVETSLSSAIASVTANETQITVLMDEKELLQATLEASISAAEDLTIRFDVVEKDKSAVEASLLGANAKVRDLEEELHRVQTCKKADDQSIQALKEYFSCLRGTQAKLFEDMEAKIDTILPSSLSQKAL